MCVYIYAYIRIYIYTHTYIYTGSFHSITRLQAAVRRATTRSKYSRMLVISLAAHQQKRMPVTMSVIDLQVRLLLLMCSLSRSLSRARALSLSLSLSHARTHANTHAHAHAHAHTHAYEHAHARTHTGEQGKQLKNGSNNACFRDRSR